MRISDCSSDVCSADLRHVCLDDARVGDAEQFGLCGDVAAKERRSGRDTPADRRAHRDESSTYARRFGSTARACCLRGRGFIVGARRLEVGTGRHFRFVERSEEHTSELQSLMRISYAVFCLKKQKTQPLEPL